VFDRAVAGDADLVRRCLNGEPSAWDDLVGLYSRYVYAIVSQGYRLSGPDAEDAFQDVFLRVYDRLGTLRDPDSIRPWIAQLTRRVCLDRVSRKEDDPHPAEPEALDATIDELDEAFAVREALGRLSGDCQDVLDRFFCRDESYRTIGQELGIPAGTIASRISRCLAKLKEQLDA
jgi:RNA polymerase sigma factor (sigma-70 family)